MNTENEEIIEEILIEHEDNFKFKPNTLFPIKLTVKFKSFNKNFDLKFVRTNSKYNNPIYVVNENKKVVAYDLPYDKVT